MNKGIDFRLFAKAAGATERYAQGDFIFREGEPSDRMYIVVSGSVEIASHGKVIETIEQGRALGFVSVLDHRPRATTARASAPCELAAMNARRFRYMVDEVPNFGWYVMHELTHRLRMLNAAIEPTQERPHA